MYITRPKMPAVDEHMITITLSPQIISHHRIKGQLKVSYKRLREACLTNGMGVVEFTKQGNVHYHIKTQENIANVYIFLDSLKGQYTLINGKKIPIFGFTKCDKTINECQINDYSYLEKNIETTNAVLKKLQLLEKCHVLWEYKQKTQRFNAQHEEAVKRLCSTSLDRLFDSESDTENLISQNILCV